MAVVRVEKNVQKQLELKARLEGMQSALNTGGGELSGLRAQILNIAGQATSLGGLVSDDGTVQATGRGQLMTPAMAAAYTAMLKALVNTFDAVDDATAAALNGAGVPQAPPQPAGPQIPAEGTDPKDVKRWWDSLSEADRQRVLREHPEQIGNLNGIPVDARSQANLAVMGADLRRVTQTAADHHVSNEEVAAHPERYGLTATDITRYNNARRVQEGLLNDAIARDERGMKPDVYLLRYQPEAFNGEGAAAIAIGNPDTADNTAVVMWMGYDAPDALPDLSVASPDMARAGAKILAADVDALDVTHDGGASHLTVIGHSYGSTTVADAAAGFGMRADDVVLIGSPGTDLARSAADFHLPPNAHLYLGAASTDPVTHFGKGQLSAPGLSVGLGIDPAIDGFGSTRFKAEVSTWSANPFHDHSEYFAAQSESLFSISDIVSGDGDALEHDGMTAPHRVGLPGDIFDNIDPEKWRLPTTGHRHSGPGG
ncbi:alpha/beta hydrolase [Mycobacterium sp.]|uniref:alpha/beta hydrolase n=1 Tax=Mycobacterium sp. TaxID=1785 RepID=UPI002C0FEEB5|nr:alpha/beta hydrolase [Mycobacterium sp.]HKP39682.1 alpha/beta hydrolase [Mycobacterium sp.]